ncbi:MAG: LysM peptidoglycan-binding domain-containing protein [Puniceicoccales bacterium]|jgi:LysM repeat protein|nr:LysM peptidoglycan-binding domain-containing protein [Puniceicoccales bacterium]
MDESPISDAPSESKLPLILSGLALIGVIVFGVYCIQLRSRLDKLATQSDQVARGSPIQQDTVKVVEQLNLTINQQTTELSNLNNSISAVKRNLEDYKRTNNDHNHVIVGALQKLTSGNRPGGQRAADGGRRSGGTADVAIPAGGIQHTIASNENLSRIASKYRVSIASILAANPGLTVSTPLKVGRVIVIPGKPTGAGAGSGATQGNTGTTGGNSTPVR